MQGSSPAPTSKSFSAVMQRAGDVERALFDARAGLPSASAGLVFVGGAPAEDVSNVAERVRAAWPGVAALVIPSAGVLTERGAIEGAPAIAGLLWRGGRSETLVLDDDVAGPLARLTEDRAATALLFCRPDWFRPELLDAAVSRSASVCLFGGGTTGDCPIAISPSGQRTEGAAALMVVRGLATPILEPAPACNVLGEFEAIEEVSAGMVLRVGGHTALDALSTCAARLKEERGASARAETEGPQTSGTNPVVFAALRAPPPAGSNDPASAAYLVRPVRGIDPSRRGVLIGPDASMGAKMTFAVLDAAKSRTNLEAAARRVAQAAAGAAPRFAIFVTCAGRGEAFYHAPDVEPRILRHRFGDLPIAGMLSAFEIAPLTRGAAKMHLYTGVLALFRSPS
jgi:small ligand-binding sensory domain FIST